MQPNIPALGQRLRVLSAHRRGGAPTILSLPLSRSHAGGGQRQAVLQSGCRAQVGRTCDGGASRGHGNGWGAHRPAAVPRHATQPPRGCGGAGAEVGVGSAGRAVPAAGGGRRRRGLCHRRLLCPATRSRAGDGGGASRAALLPASVHAGRRGRADAGRGGSPHATRATQGRVLGAGRGGRVPPGGGPRADRRRTASALRLPRAGLRAAAALPGRARSGGGPSPAGLGRGLQLLSPARGQDVGVAPRPALGPSALHLPQHGRQVRRSSAEDPLLGRRRPATQLPARRRAPRVPHGARRHLRGQTLRRGAVAHRQREGRARQPQVGARRGARGGSRGGVPRRGPPRARDGAGLRFPARGPAARPRRRAAHLQGPRRPRQRIPAGGQADAAARALGQRVGRGRLHQRAHLQDGRRRRRPDGRRAPRPRPQAHRTAARGAGLRRLHVVPAGDGARALRPGGVRLRRQPARDVPRGPAEAALVHVPAQGHLHALALLARHAHRPLGRSSIHEENPTFGHRSLKKELSVKRVI